ncbi:MAG: S9 family peptidase [Chitinophagaceae bacterium]|nr:S9 family peptidase [Chitinophagaceae bacterium]
MKTCKYILFFFLIFVIASANAQDIHWSKDGLSFYQLEDNQITRTTLPGLEENVFIGKSSLQVKGVSLQVNDFTVSEDGKTVLLFTNAKKVWRYNTKGDYWLYNVTSGKLKQVGTARPVSTLMFAKISPDGTKVAYVSGYNIYVEDIITGAVITLTKGGNRKLINGTFDWAYEEEFFCRDGFRWSPDSRNIAYWQIDARKVKDYLMINETDSIYPVITPVEYPVAGEAPSPFKIGVVSVKGGPTKWMGIPSDPLLQSYVPRMEWAANSSQLIVQHLSRKQNASDLLLCNIADGSANKIYGETDEAWIDILALWDEDYAYGGWDWINNGKEFLWASEKDGWRHLYRISRDGKSETLVTRGAYDVMDICSIDEANGFVYYMASPTNATQKYLYRISLDGKGTAERLSPSNQPGTHKYDVSPAGNFAYHSFSNYYTPDASGWVSLPTHKALGEDVVNNAIAKSQKPANIDFFSITSADNITMDAWMVKPKNFDSTKKYPVVFYVYTEPWGQLVQDKFGTGRNQLYAGNLADDGYIYIAIDNRGTPVPKGRAWRKSVYKKIGLVNIRDQAMAAKEIFKRSYIDTGRVAVWGWSGGGSATLNLMFQYPDIYKTGIAIAAVGNQLTYDNLYQERYMGLPADNRQDFVNGSPITYAKNLQGNLLYIHGTGDDNVHYNNAEMLLNELIKHNKQFQFMPYPNRTHSISEGEGTFKHLSTLYTQYLRKNCPPGGR